MISEVRMGQQLVRIDTEATATLYRNPALRAGADECTCASCRNFAEQRTKAYPQTFVAFLRQVGIDPSKELEAFDYDFDAVAGLHLYGGWFILCGEIAEGAEWRPERESGAFTCWFTDSFPTSGLPTERKLCAVEFCTSLPWVGTDTNSPHLAR